MPQPIGVERCALCERYARTDAMIEVELSSEIRRICPKCFAEIEANSQPV